MRAVAIASAVAALVFAPSAAASARLIVPVTAERGQTIRITVRVAPRKSSCILALRGPGGRMVQLPEKVTTSGSVAWTWRIGGTAALGEWLVGTACLGAGRDVARFTVRRAG